MPSASIIDGTPHSSSHDSICSISGPWAALDLLGQVANVGIDSVLREDEVAHLDRLLVMRDHHLREHDIGLTELGRPHRPGSPSRP